MSIKGIIPFRLITGLLILLLFWFGLGIIGPLMYWSDFTLVWNKESVTDLRSFLLFRTVAFGVIGFTVLFIGSLCFWKRISTAAYLAYTSVFAMLSAVFMTFFIPEGSPVHIFYREVPSTRYVEGFHPRDFLSLHPGMTKERVAKQIGVGRDDIWFGGTPYESPTWVYSGPGSENHWRYWLHFDDDGILESIQVSYWWD